jgi:RNA polymerase sigma-70 factor, ECF subfamily
MSSSSTARFSSFALPREKRIAACPVQDSSQVPADIPDEVLLVRISGGDREFLAQLFRRYAPTIFAIGRRILRDAGEAEDLVQEVFLYLHKKCGLYDPSKGPARSWLIQVAYTQALLRRRKLKSHGHYELPDAVKMAEMQTSGVDYDKTGEGLFGRSGWKALRRDLSDAQLEILRLHFFEGYSFAEIAEKIPIPYASVRSRYYRALERIRRHVCDGEPERRLTQFQE